MERQKAFNQKQTSATDPPPPLLAFKNSLKPCRCLLRSSFRCSNISLVVGPSRTIAQEQDNQENWSYRREVNDLPGSFLMISLGVGF